MFCVKCGKEVNKEQQFCTNCGQRVGGNVITEENTETISKGNKSFEEKSAEIVSGVKGTVNNFAEKGAEFADKVKHDEKVNQAFNNVKNKIKSNPNTVIVVSVAAVLIVALIGGLLAFGGSSPKKAVKGFVSAMDKGDFKKAIKYTTFEEMIEELAEEEAYWSDDDVDDLIDEVYDDMEQEFEDMSEDRSIKVKDIKVKSKSDKKAKVEATVVMKEDGDKEEEEMDFIVRKKDGKWLVDVTQLGW